MELFVFSQDEQLLTIISEDTGLVEALYRIEVNSIPTEPFSFTVESDQKVAGYVKEENKVVFKDHEGDWRLMNIKEVDDSNDTDGPVTIAICEPAFLAELNEHIVVDRQFVNQTADVVLAAAVEGTRWQASVEVELGRATASFYYISSIEAIWNIIEIWGGEFKDIVNFDETTNTINGCYVKILQRLGAENGQRFEIDHNTTEIGRTVLSYPKTALYGQGASLKTENDDSTRYIDFGDVEWRADRGDPVDKPLGQKWVGDPDALDKYGILEEGKKRHRDGTYSNQDYEEPSELLYATWESLQKAKKPEVNYRLSVELFNEKVNLGDTCQAIDRKFARPIEIQARVIAMEYDLMDIEGTMVVEMGQFLDLGADRITDLEKEVENIKNHPPKSKIDEESYPNIKPDTPVNLEAEGGFQVVQLYWDYDEHLYISHYEVYGSRTEDFVPDTQHLLWKGRVSGFSHDVGTDEVWYYQVRAVNYHGTPSDWSVQVRAATYRVISDDILFGEDIAEELRDLSKTSKLLADGTIDLSTIGDDVKSEITTAKNRANEAAANANIATDNALEAIEDAQEAFDKAANASNEALMAKSIAEATDDLVGAINTTVDGHSTEIIETKEVLGYKMNTVDANAKFAAQSQLTATSSSLQSRITEVQGNIDKMQIGGRNLLINSKNIYNQSNNSSTQPVLQTSIDDFVRYNSAGGGGRIDLYNTLNQQWGSNFYKLTNGDWMNKYVTASVLARTDRPNTFIRIRLSDWFADTKTLRQELVPLPVNQWSRISVTARPQDIKRNIDEDNIIRIFIAATTSGTNHSMSLYADMENYYLDLKDWQIEFGNKVTDWSPAPEDLTTQIQFSQLNQKVDTITASVTKKVDTVTYNSFVQQTAQSLSSKISEQDANNKFATQSSLTQTAQGLQTMVEGISSPGENLIINGGFENDFFGWKSNFQIGQDIIIGTGNPRAGKKALHFESPSGQRTLYLNKNVVLEPGRTYEFSCWYRTSSNANGSSSYQKLRIGNPNTGSQMLSLSWNGANTSWSKLSRIWTVPSSITSAEISVCTNHTQGWVQWDDISIIDVTNREDTKSQITQLAGVINTKITRGQADGWYASQSQLTQTASSLQSSITGVRDDLDDLDIGGRNLLTNSRNVNVSTNNSSTMPVSYTKIDDYVRVKPTGGSNQISLYTTFNNDSGIRGESHKITNTDWLGKYVTGSVRVRTDKEGLFIRIRLSDWGANPNSLKQEVIPIPPNQWVQVSVTAAPTDIQKKLGDDVARIMVYASDGGTANNTNTDMSGHYLDLKDWQIEFGNKVTDWSPAPEDLATQSQFSQLSDAINLRVQKGDVINQINVDTSGILISGQKVRITGQTTIDNGAIKNAAIAKAAITSAKIASAAVGTAAIADAAITKLKLGRAVVGTAQIEDGAITNAKIGDATIDTAKIANSSIINAKIANLSADKISGGTIDANKVTVKVTNGVQEIQLNDKGIEAVDSKGNVRLHLGVRNIAGKGQSDPSTIRFFSGNGNISAGVGMNVNGHFIIGSQSNGVSTSIYSDSNQLYYAQQHRFVMGGVTRPDEYIQFTSIENTSGTRREPYIRTPYTASGYIGSANYTWWRIYASNIHESSTIERKTSISNCDTHLSYKVLKGMEIKQYRSKTSEGNPTGEWKFGVISEYAPKEILDISGKAVSLYSMISHTANVVKDHTSRLLQLDEENNEIRKENEKLVFKVADLEKRLHKLEGSA